MPPGAIKAAVCPPPDSKSPGVYVPGGGTFIPALLSPLQPPPILGMGTGILLGTGLMAQRVHGVGTLGGGTVPNTTQTPQGRDER